MSEIKKIKYALIICVYSLISTSVYSQSNETFDIKAVESDKMESKCKSCLQVLSNKPPEVTMGFQVADDYIYFVMTDAKWFTELFKKSKDGFAVDIVKKDQYSCTGETKKANSPIHIGELLAPFYFSDFKNKIMQTPTGEVFIKYTKLPSKFIGTDYELNLMIIQNGNECHYTSFYDIPSYRWELLKMGLYKDTIPDSSLKKMLIDKKYTEKSEYFDKKLKFTVPFQKNKFNYSNKDIQPLYDSLKLTDYNINKVKIQAYSSVEGSTEKNIQLQQKRAESIVKALQSFQTKAIKPEIETSENWQDFLIDLKYTKYPELADLNKEQIKEQLNNSTISNHLEIILSSHRKAEITLELQKKSTTSSEATIIKSFYTKAIESKNIDEAKAIQAYIFQKIKDKDFPEDLVKNVTIPKTIEYGSLLANNAAFKYEYLSEELIDTYKAFKELDELTPNDKKIKYNLCALQLKLWLENEAFIEPQKLNKEITELGSIYKMDIKLVKRLLLNYHIINSEYLMLKRDYDSKNISIDFIFKNYKYANLEVADILSLSKYFSSYSRHDLSLKVILPYVNQAKPDEEILFYYLNLTIFDKSYPKKIAYRALLAKAIDINHDRYCKIFDPFGQGGITFQLLDDKYLKDIYCKECN